MLVVIVMERTGTPFFLVRRREAEMLPWADLRARWRGWRESSRLMVLEGSADWMVQFSKRKSIGSVLCKILALRLSGKENLFFFFF